MSLHVPAGACILVAHTTKYSIATWHTYYNVYYPLDLLIAR